MATHYVDEAAMCPFYKGIGCNSNYAWINCEGILPGSVTKQQFRSRRKRDQHKETACDCFDYKKCPVYEAINEKYQ